MMMNQTFYRNTLPPLVSGSSVGVSRWMEVWLVLVYVGVSVCVGGRMGERVNAK
jgi:hypothetical protein